MRENSSYCQTTALILGRDFMETDGESQPRHREAGVGPETSSAKRLPILAILSYEYFQRRYGGDRSIIGRPLRTGSGLLVVGVLAPGFELFFPPGMSVERKPDIWTATHLQYDNAHRLLYFLRPIARLKKGVNLDQAQGETDTVAAEIRKTSLIEGTAGFRARVEPMHNYVVTAARPAILRVLGAGIFLLLIACANVTNLMLVRMSLRERELAVRTSLGGTWWQLMRQTLTEALLIAGIGTTLRYRTCMAGHS